MNLLDLVTRNRSYRGYSQEERPSPQQLRQWVELARLCPSSVNLQPLKYRLIWKQEELDKIQPLTGWARRLPERKLPDPGHCPTAFVVICQDKNLASDVRRFWKDVGIVAQTILLGAVEAGFGGCMIGNFSPEAVWKTLSLPEQMEPVLLVALGKPDETVLLEDAAPGDSVDYYRDEQDRHHVPKRTLDEILL